MNIGREQLLSYYMGQSTADEQQAIEQALRDDPSLSELAEDCRRVAEGFRHMKRARIREEAEEFEAVYKPATRTRTLSTNRRYWVAAATIALLVTAYLLWPRMSIEQQLADTYFTLPINPSTAGGGTDDLYTQGLDQFYTNRDYRAARKTFQELKDDPDQGIRAQYYLAHSMYKLGDLEGAYELFTTLEAQEEAFSLGELQNIRWNRWLIGLALGKETIDNAPEHPRKQDLLDQLNE